MAVPAGAVPVGRGVAPSARFGGFAYGWEVGLLVVMVLAGALGLAAAISVLNSDSRER